MGRFADAALGILFPPWSQMTDQENTEAALQQQTQAGEESKSLMGEQFDYLKGLNEPLIQMGDSQLEALRSGDFQADESIFRGYSPYTSSIYSPQGMYQNQGIQPGFSGPAPVSYSGSGQPGLAAERAVYAPGRKPDAFTPGAAPDRFSYAGQQPQFTPYSQGQQQPQQYIAPEAQGADYWRPDQFNIENDAVFQNALSSANEATEASAAARGMQLSGKTLTDIQGNAVDLANQYGNEAFGRHMATQQMNRAAQGDINQDQYGRYMDQVGIRGAEGQQALGQYNLNRDFGQGSNIQNAQMGNQMWNTGFQNQLAAQGQEYGQYATGRGMGAQEQQTQYGQYAGNRDYQLAATGQQSANDLSRFGAQSGQYNQNLQNQLAVQGQNWQQAYAPYAANLGQYNQNRAFNYGVYGDYGSQLSDAFRYNTANSQMENALGYQGMTDTYNRDAARQAQRYGQVGDVVNVGLGGRQNMGAAAGDFWGSTADLTIGQANAYAAAMAAKNQQSGLLQSLGL